MPIIAPVSAFPPARKHLRQDDLIAANDSFFLEAWPFVSPAERDFFVQWNLGSFVSKTIPDGDYARMIWSCRVNTFFFLLDDMIEKGAQYSLTERIVGIMHGDMVALIVSIFTPSKTAQSPQTGSPVEEVADQIFRAMQASTGPEQYTQFCRLTCEYLNFAFLRKQEPQVYRDISEYLETRCVDFAGHFVLANTRYALGIYVTDEELESPLLASCEKLALDAGAMENDVVSYEKELEQNTLGYNLVAMLLQQGIDGRAFASVASVKDYIRERIADCEARLHATISAALEDEKLAMSDNVCRWLLALPYIVSGNTWWSQEVSAIIGIWIIG
ncbi:isoprenoid synthase domain-containing protein [Mycena capillaripes]|nr:isoprenoid synthase domain-containing protein [Mycena capillaripes]